MKWSVLSQHKQILLAKSKSKEKSHVRVMANKEIWINPISVVFSQSHQAGQVWALAGDFGALSDFNYLETEQAIRANDKAWTQRIRAPLGRWCTEKTLPTSRYSLMVLHKCNAMRLMGLRYGGEAVVDHLGLSRSSPRLAAHVLSETLCSVGDEAVK